MIDISSVSYNLGFPNYILNSFQSNLNNFNNIENSFICFATYDNKGVQFYTLNKNKEIHINFMNDIYNPFAPVSPKHIFFNIKNDQDDIIILIEKINSYPSHSAMMTSAPFPATMQRCLLPVLENLS